MKTRTCRISEASHYYTENHEPKPPDQINPTNLKTSENGGIYMTAQTTPPTTLRTSARTSHKIRRLRDPARSRHIRAGAAIEAG